MAIKIGIGQKIILAVGLIFILFSLALSLVIGFTNFNNLTQVKQAELERMSQILSSRISAIEQNAVQVALNFEENERLISELQLLSIYGPYYADPGSYFSEDFMNGTNPIDDADRVYRFQAQLNLIQQLWSTRQVNDFSAISFYLTDPFQLVDVAPPVLAFRLDDSQVIIGEFLHKGGMTDPLIYQAMNSNFRPPLSEEFNISTAYSTPPEEFYLKSGFEPVKTELPITFFNPSRQSKVIHPRSQIVLDGTTPIIQTWHPVNIPLANPISWQLAPVPAGIVVIEQRLDNNTLAILQKQLGVNVGFAQTDTLLISTLGEESIAQPLTDEMLLLSYDQFYYANLPIVFSDSTTADLDAVVFSPISIITNLTWNLLTQIFWLASITIVITTVVLYISMRYLVSRPFSALMRGVQRVSTGDLTHPVAVQSNDEFGELATAFNDMTGQLHNTQEDLRRYQETLEDQVAERTIDLQEANENLQNEIVERQQAQDRLAEERNVLRVLIDTIPYQIYIKDMQSHFIMVNQYCIKFWELSETEILSKTDFDLFRPDLAQKIFEEEQTLLQTGEPLLKRESTVIDPKTNEARWFVHSKVPFRDAQNNIVGLVGISRDVTERKEAQLALLKANQELEKLNADKDRFFSIVAHDLKGPFMPLLGNAELLAEMADLLPAEEIKTMGQSIHASGQRVLDLLENLLQWSRLQMGRMPFDPTPIRLQAIADQTVALLSETANSKSIQLTNQIANQLIAYADEYMVDTIIRNLTNNALKFTPLAGQVTIKAKLLSVQNDDEIAYIEIAIVDSGVGISAENQQKLFQIDVHHSTSGTAKEQGTGLGLIMCQEMVEMNGGNIWIESELGQGTTVKFTVPASIVIQITK